MSTAKHPVMITTTWNNGAHHQTGAGYGLRFQKADVRAHFQPHWVKVKFEATYGQHNQVFDLPLAATFYPKCHEIRSKQIGQWFQKIGINHWSKGKPHLVTVRIIKGR